MFQHILLDLLTVSSISNLSKSLWGSSNYANALDEMPRPFSRSQDSPGFTHWRQWLWEGRWSITCSSHQTKPIQTKQSTFLSLGHKQTISPKFSLTTFIEPIIIVHICRVLLSKSELWTINECEWQLDGSFLHIAVDCHNISESIASLRLFPWWQ